MKYGLKMQNYPFVIGGDLNARIKEEVGNRNAEFLNDLVAFENLKILNGREATFQNSRNYKSTIDLFVINSKRLGSTLKILIILLLFTVEKALHKFLADGGSVDMLA